MNQQQRHRGHHLVAADRRFSTGGGLIARLTAGGFGRLLDAIDAGLETGSIEVTLPDGAIRKLGGRAAAKLPYRTIGQSDLDAPGFKPGVDSVEEPTESTRSQACDQSPAGRETPVSSNEVVTAMALLLVHAFSPDQRPRI